MIRNYLPLTTLVRNKVNSKRYDSTFFEGRGVRVKVEDENLYSLRNNGLKKSELTPLCEKGLIFRGGQLVCYKGQEVKEYTLEEARKLDWFIWNDKTVFSSPIEGKRVYMYWDPKYNDWGFADDKIANSDTYREIFKRQINNIYELESNFTYVFKVQGNARSHQSPVLLETIIDHKKGYEVMWDQVDRYGVRLKIDSAHFYKFEGFDTLDKEDFPLYAIDKSKNKIYIKALK